MHSARVLIAAIVMAATPLLGFAQSSPIQRGSVQVGGSLSLSHRKDEGSGGSPTNTTTIQLFPQLGYFVARGLEFSANLQYVHISSDQSGSGTQWGVGPAVTYYPFKNARRLHPYIAGRTFFTWEHFDIGGVPLGSQRITENGQEWLSAVGALLMVGDHVGVTGEAFYMHVHFSENIPGQSSISTKSTSYGVEWGVQAFIF